MVKGWEVIEAIALGLATGTANIFAKTADTIRRAAVIVWASLSSSILAALSGRAKRHCRPNSVRSDSPEPERCKRCLP